MVYVDDAESANARIELACDLADLLDAGLIGISGSVPDLPVVDPYTGGATFGEIWRQEQQIAADDIKRAEARFQTVAGARRSHMAWRGRVDYPAELVAAEARAADLIILGQTSLRPPPHHAADPGDVIMAAGRPVLVVPEKPPQTRMLDHALVAWKDCREARRAVADALPLLAKAAKTTLIAIAESGDEVAAGRSVEDAANFLRRHGANATALALPAGAQSAAEQLLTYAEANGVGLMVLGGYGHARAREWIFGGVTQTLLQRSPVCCLFSH
jgi:nucleotide-binding universal stress UspA family protein